MATQAVGQYGLTYGPSEAQCCFAEDQATNDAGAAGIPVSIRGLRNDVKRD